MRATLLMLLIFVMPLVRATPAAALSCSFAISDFDFGSIDATLDSVYTTSATFSVNCTATAFSKIYICPNFGNGSGGTSAAGDPRSMLSGKSALNFNIYKTSSYASVWGSYFWGKPPVPRTLTLTMSSSTVSGWLSVPIYARISAGQSAVVAGAFSSLFTGTDSLVGYAFANDGGCEKIAGTNGVSVPFSVRASNASACKLAATELDFSSTGVLDANVDSTNAVKLACTNGAPFSVGLGGGASDAADPQNRKMISGAAQITYGLYRDSARTLPWGNTVGSNTYSGVGTGAAQALTIYGRVKPQPTPAPGTYTDVVVVTVTY